MQPHDTTSILIVDDEPSLRELLTDALSGPDFSITVAGSGKEAIKLGKDNRPDFLVTDLRLGDCTGLDVIDSLRDDLGQDIPAVVITGYGDPDSLTQASQRRPVELMTKPLDLDRLKSTIREELARRAVYKKQMDRARKLRKLARTVNIERKSVEKKLGRTCADLTAAYRALSGQLALQKVVMSYQTELIGSKNDDDVFRHLFRLFVRRTGPLFGIAMVTDENANLKIIGRFGVPYPDSLEFCERLVDPLINETLSDPTVSVKDLWDERDRFDQSIRKKLVGISTMAIPLIPKAGEMIGMVVMYRKGEQPFVEMDTALADLISHPTAVAIAKND